MIKGLFRKDRLLEVIKDFIYFPDNSDKDLKIVCRYPQFFAANKLYENIKAHLRPEGDGKGGTYFGATGCGKSYTMLFLTRMLMKSKYFSSPTILIITDRTDLDDQLSKQFVGSKKYIGDETVVSIESREKLREELQGRESGGVYLTTIQKFTEDLQLLTEQMLFVFLMKHIEAKSISTKRLRLQSQVFRKPMALQSICTTLYQMQLMLDLPELRLMEQSKSLVVL